MPPMSAADYRERAEACERLAEASTSEHVREIMLYVASRWRGLANEEDARPKPHEPLRRDQLRQRSD